MAYRANVSDKEQTDIENALNDSAVRLPWFTPDSQPATKFVRAYDAERQTAVVAQTDVRKFPGNALGSHNDKPWMLNG